MPTTNIPVEKTYTLITESTDPFVFSSSSDIFMEAAFFSGVPDENTLGHPILMTLGITREHGTGNLYARCKNTPGTLGVLSE